MTDLPPLPVAPANGGSKGDKYGLGSWGGVLVDLGPLFGGYTVPNQHGIATDSKGNQSPATNADDAYQAFLAAPPQVQAQIQQELNLAGYYPQTAFIDPGTIGPDDEAAFKKFLVTVVQTQDSARNQNMPVINAAAQLAQRATFGQQQGGLAQAQAAAQATQPTKPTTIRLTDPAAVGLTYEKAAEQELGFKPDQREVAAFVAGFRAREKAAQLTPANPAQVLPTLSGAQGYGPNAPSGPLGIPTAAPLGASPQLAAQEQLGQAADQNANLDQVANALGVVTPLGDWAANAQAAGLGQGAPQTPANTQFVLRYLLSRALQTTGDWTAAITKVTGDPQMARQVASQVNTADLSLNAPVGQLTVGQPPAPGDQTSIVTPPDLSAEAVAAARRNHPGAYGANQTAQAFDNFLTAIGVHQ